MAQAAKSSERLFIESLPSSMPPREVIARAKAIGLTIKLKKIYRVRAENAGAKPVPKIATATSAGSAGKKASPKAAFILSFPGSATAREIIAAGVKQGIAVSENYVSLVRTGGRRRKGTKRAAVSAPLPSRPAAVAARSVEARLAELVLEVGLDRVAAVVADVRGKLESLL